ncbi:MAG: hypothetical protein LBO67_10000 [Spirochaetaceae bacterium]|nr:hypothetical protein [Spirochaetaceae bacterium]
MGIHIFDKAGSVQRALSSGVPILRAYRDRSPPFYRKRCAAPLLTECLKSLEYLEFLEEKLD